MHTQTVNSLAFIPGLTAFFKKLKIAPAQPVILLVVILSSIVSNSYAQQEDTAYQKVLLQRSAKIVAELGISDTIVINKVTKQVSQQYYQLNAIHDKSKAAVAAIKAANLPKEQTDEQVKLEVDKKSAQLKQLHNHFIALLEKRLTPAQVEKIKDGMTYKVLPVTWAAYMDMLQNLTPEQKAKMYSWLVEARELAMDEGSSDAKHAVFGKYKGRINNYLSAAGYDMKKEGEEWQKRIAAAKKTKQKTN
jgi:Spy/CpxP family protein refolding chaperone